MPDYSLGRAHGKIEISYDGSGADKASRDLERVAASSADADKSLSKTGATLEDTGRHYDSVSKSAQGYSARQRELQSATRDLDIAVQQHHATLLNSKSSLDDIAAAEDNVARAKKRHEQATNSEREAHRALSAELNIGQRVMRGISDLMPNLHQHFIKLGQIEQDVSQKSNALAKGLGVLAKAASVIPGEGKAAAVGLEVLSKGFDKAGTSASAGASHVASFVQHIASFELAFGKIAGLTLALPSLGGLAGLGGAAGLQGLVEVAGAVEQLSGLLGLLPGAIAGAVFSVGTLKVAFHGVGDALKDMMADDPKKFLEDIAHMGPMAAQSMLQIAQFRNLFMAGGAAIQDSFFAKIAADIAPIVQTWAPAVISAMSQVSGIFGQFAHELAFMLQQPEAMRVFELFIDNLSDGLRSLLPAVTPLVNIFAKLVGEGSSFFGEIGTSITQALGAFDQFLGRAQQSGQLHDWIQTGINAFGHLMHTIEQAGSAFMRIMTVADKFGGGGLLGWLDQVTAKFDAWTSSAQGQQTLADFFSVLRTATDAFLPMLKPLVEGLASIGQAFVMLGVGIAPGWQTFFNTFASTMAQLGPQIVGMGPALNQFLTQLSQGFAQVMAQIGPELPQIFSALSNAFVALLPQLPVLANLFAQLVVNVGPQLPKLFESVTAALYALAPLFPVIIGLVRQFTSVITFLVQVFEPLINGIKAVNDGIMSLNGSVGKDLPQAVQRISDTIGGFFNNLIPQAEQWGRNLLQGLIRGLSDATGLNLVGGAVSRIGGVISDFLRTRSPAKRGPLHDMSPNEMGARVVGGFATGMAAAQGAVESAASSTAQAAAGGMGGGRAPFAAGMEAAGGALLPDNIAGADTSILDAYLRHQFDDNRGLKGLAKDLGAIVNGMQSGITAFAQQGAQQVMQTLMSMPFAQQQAWRKIPADVFARQQAAELQRKALQQGPQWTDVLGPTGAAGVAGVPGGPQQTPLNVTASSSKEQIQRAIIAAGRARGLSDEAIQTALAVAAAESGFNPTISGGVQGSAGLVSGLFQQSPSSGWGTLEQVNDPNYAINAFYNAFVKQLANNPSNPLLAAVLTQNPQLGGAAQGSDYMAAVMRQLGLAQSIMASQGKAGWVPLTGGPGVANVPIVGLPPGAKVGHDGSISVPAGVPLPTTLPGGAGAGLNPATRAGQVPIAPNVEAGIRAIGGLPTLYPTSGPGAYQVPAWAQQLASMFGLTASTYASGGSLHQMGYAFDFNAPEGPVAGKAKLEAFASFIQSQLMGQTLQLIFRGSKDYGIASGQNVGPGYYAGDLPGHTDHVHWATDVPPVMMGADGSLVPVVPAPPGGLGQMAGRGVTLPSGQPLSQFVDPTTGKVYSGNDQLLNQYLQGNPGLAAQIAAAQQPGAPQQQVLDALTGIDSAVNGLKAQDAITNQDTINALQSTQSQIAQTQGFQQGPNAMQFFSTVMGGASNIASSILQAVQGGLDSLAATQDIADRLVYGVRNTEDINAIVDDVQKYITFASQIASATGQILSTIGGVVGAGGSGDPSGGSQGAAMALSAAGQIAQLIAGVLQGVNAAIDFGQQIYHIAGTYVGRLLSNLVAGPFGTPLMGDVRFLLNQNTGQLISYSRDNPGNQNALNIPPWMTQALGYGGGNANPGIGQMNVYAGPGQSTGEMMREVVWMVDTSGPPTGAMQASNF